MLDDLVLQLQLLEERAALLQLVRVSQDRADELRHQPRRLDCELVERVRLAAENGQDSDDGAVAVEWRADQRPDAEARADVAVGRAGRSTCLTSNRLVVQRREPGEARRAVEAKADVTGRDPGAVVVHRLVPFEPLHGRAVAAAEALRAQDDRARQRLVVELERGDLLLRLHDRVQTAEARAAGGPRCAAAA